VSLTGSTAGTADESSTKRLAAALKKVFLTLAGLIMLGAIAVGVGLVWAASFTEGEGVYFNLWIGIGVGLIASGVYSVFSTLFAYGALEKSLSATVDARIESVAQTVADEGQRVSGLLTKVDASVAEQGKKVTDLIQEWHRRFLPDRQWQASRLSSDDLNTELNRSVRESSTYIFQGITGRAAAARIYIVKPRSLISATFIIGHPGVSTPRDTYETWDTASAQRQQAEQDRFNEILTTLVGAHQVRSLIPNVTIALVSEPPVDRTEITQDHCYVSRYTLMPEQEHYRFPPMTRYPSGSVTYVARSQECTALVNAQGDKVLRLPAAGSRDEFLKLLRRLRITMSNEQYEHHLAEFNETVDELEQRLLPDEEPESGSQQDGQPTP
jgi:hypothetical protein